MSHKGKKSHEEAADKVIIGAAIGCALLTLLGLFLVAFTEASMFVLQTVVYIQISLIGVAIIAYISKRLK